MKLLIAIIILLVLAMFFMVPMNESFSHSGLTMSDDYCRKLAYVYNRPHIKDLECRRDFSDRICGGIRRRTIDSRTGNYFTENGVLV